MFKFNFKTQTAVCGFEPIIIGSLAECSTTRPHRLSVTSALKSLGEYALGIFTLKYIYFYDIIFYTFYYLQFYTILTHINALIMY